MTDTHTPWIALFRAYAAARAEVDKTLKSTGHPPLEWYDVLLELERVSPDGLRAVDLEKRLLLPQHGVSRLVARMVDQRLVLRSPGPDGRGPELCITEKGRALRASMWAEYGPIIARCMAPLNAEEADTLAGLLQKIT